MGVSLITIENWMVAYIHVLWVYSVLIILIIWTILAYLICKGCYTRCDLVTYNLVTSYGIESSSILMTHCM